MHHTRRLFISPDDTAGAPQVGTANAQSPTADTSFAILVQDFDVPAQGYQERRLGACLGGRNRGLDGRQRAWDVGV